MKNLIQYVEDGAQREALVADVTTLIDAEVKGKKGLSGAMVRAAYATVKAIKPNMMQEAIDKMLDQWVVVLQGYCDRRAQQEDARSLEQYLGAHRIELAEALLLITDQRALKSKRKTAVKAYKRLRTKGKANVEEAVFGLGRVLDRHLA